MLTSNKMLKLFLFHYYHFIIIIIIKVNPTASQMPCYFTNSQSNRTWELIWEDQFDGDKKAFEADWNVVHEIKVCKTFFSEQVSCSDRQNVHLHKGYLALTARYDQNRRNFTGAEISYRRTAFTEGRYEIKASQPIANYVQACFYTQNNAESAGLFQGMILIHCFNPPNNPTKAVIYKDLYGSVKPRQNSKESVNLSGFHLYGVEWNRREVKFFVDQTFTEPIVLKHEINEKHKLHLQIMVSLVNLVMPNITDSQFWPCPAYIVDYIRVYKPRIGSKLPENSTKCELTNSTNEEEENAISTEMCQISKKINSETESENDSENTTQNHLSNLLIAVTLLLIFCLLCVVYFLIKIYRKRKQIEQQQIQQLQNELEYDFTDENEYYEIIYEKTFRDSSIQHDYLDVNDVVGSVQKNVESVDHEESDYRARYETITGDEDKNVERHYLSMSKE